MGQEIQTASAGVAVDDNENSHSRGGLRAPDLGQVAIAIPGKMAHDGDRLEPLVEVVRQRPSGSSDHRDQAGA